MDLKEIRSKIVAWLLVAQGTDQLRAFVNVVMNRVVS
jgi:hypothetical protein